MSTVADRRAHPPEMVIEEWLASDNWPHRSFSLPAKCEPRGQIIFVGGRGDFFEKYLEAIRHWSQSGWDVAGFDWRGQGGSGLMHPSGYCHATDFGRQVRDLAEFADQIGNKNALPRVAIGHSLGGHLLLRGIAESQVMMSGIVLLSPMIGIRAGPINARITNCLGVVGHLPLLANRPVWEVKPSSAPGHMTACQTRHDDKLWWKANYPEIARSGPTWKWVAAATRSMKYLERTLSRSRSQTPGLLLTGTRDRVIDSAAVTRIGGLLPNLKMEVIRNGGHELLRESDKPRNTTFVKIDAFLKETARQD